MLIYKLLQETYVTEYQVTKMTSPLTNVSARPQKRKHQCLYPYKYHIIIKLHFYAK